MIIGIDLGTTNSAVGFMDQGHPRLIPNALGDFLTPSVIAVDDSGEMLVGKTAAEYGVLHPERCAAVFKRFMGSDRTLTVADKKFTPEQLSSIVLRSLKADAEAHFGKPVERAVITVPAYFNDNQRKATIRAGSLAGLKVERILNEPTAAAIAYGLHDAGSDKVAAVIDLGGGTFDVSIVELFDGTIEVRASSGECFLGGEDFTRSIAAKVLERRGFTFERIEMEAPLLVSRLIGQCERLKRTLSSRDSAEVRIPERDGTLREDAPLETVSRTDFQQWTELLLGRMEMPIRRCLGDAKLTRHDVHDVILVGGATRMPAVIQRVEEIFAKRPRCTLNPDEVVALGASVQAGLVADDRTLEELVVTDVCPFTLGIQTTKDLGGRNRGGYFLPIISRNTVIPVSRVERVQTLHPNQTAVEIHVYQGEHRRVEGNLLLGKFELKGIPPGPPGQEIDVRFTYDLNGVLEAEATIVTTKKTASIVITQHAKNLSSSEIANALKQMEAIKFHPREDAVNRFLLRRAERLFEELPRDERDRLSMLLDGFESSLEEQAAPDVLAKWRDTLLEFFRRFDPEADRPETPEEEGDAE